MDDRSEAQLTGRVREKRFTLPNQKRGAIREKMRGSIMCGRLLFYSQWIYLFDEPNVGADDFLTQAADSNCPS